MDLESIRERIAHDPKEEQRRQKLEAKLETLYLGLQGHYRG